MKLVRNSPEQCATSRIGPSVSNEAAYAIRHAFIVDDELQFRRFMSMALTGAGFIVSEFGGIAELEAALTQRRPEIIILDLSLGSTDAVEIMRSLAASLFNGTIMLVSGHDSITLKEVQEIGSRYGLAMLPFLRKPFRIAELGVRIAQLTVPPRPTPGDASLRTALQNNWLELWYQPKLDLRSMSICGAEALVRIRHPERGIISPSNFLPPAGDPLYKPLSDFVVRRALIDWPALSSVRSNIRLAVNVPISVLQNPAFVNSVLRHLPKHPNFPGLIAEITEDEAISEPELARDAAIQLKLHNISVSIDDFGAGFSSLARLKELPFGELKLDRSFVHGCAGHADKREMCQSVIDLAHRFKLTAVAEGVETADDLQVLVGMGYDLAQGYYFEKPMPSDDFMRMLAASSNRA